LNPVRGREQAGLRPVLILSHDLFNKKSETVIAMAITSHPQKAGFPLTLTLPPEMLPKSSWVKISQIRTISLDRLGRKKTVLAIRFHFSGELSHLGSLEEGPRERQSQWSLARQHDNRHTVVTELAESGAGEEVIMGIAGHVSRAMLSRYSHIGMEAKHRALDGIAARLTGNGRKKQIARKPNASRPLPSRRRRQRRRYSRGVGAPESL
jgi:mRNA-degrading endonuclease toxin of MazEF toxin-antitoxin module